MAPPEVWGPAVWTLIHTLSEKINENAYPRLFTQLFIIIQKICKYLPCPECSRDASIFLAKINMRKLKNKTEFKNLFYVFHNYVNVKKRKPLFNYGYINLYKKHNLSNIINKFLNAYNTKGNMKLLSESFQRQFVLNDFKKWISANLGAFLPSRVPNTISRNSEEQKSNFNNSDASNNLIIPENNNIIEENEQKSESSTDLIINPIIDTTIVEEEKTTIVEEVKTTIVEEEKTTIVEEENTTIVEEENTTIVEEENTTIVEEIKTTIVEDVIKEEEFNNEDYISEISDNFDFDNEEPEDADDSNQFNLESSVWDPNLNNENLELEED